MIWSLGPKVQDLGLRVWGSGTGVTGYLGCRVQESGLRFRLWGSGKRVQGTLGILLVQGSRFGVVWGSGLKDKAFSMVSGCYSAVDIKWAEIGETNYYVRGTAFKKNMETQVAKNINSEVDTGGL